MEYQSDNDLQSKEENDHFLVKRIFKFFILSLVIVVIAVLTVYFLKEVHTNANFRDLLLDNIVRELSTIAISAIAILGFGFTYKK